MTERAEHTAGPIPGPWFYDQESVDPEWYIVTIKGGLVVANVNAHSRQEANARLIAAAPDLLAACQEFVRKVECGEAKSTRSYEQMKAAISKATGES